MRKKLFKGAKSQEDKTDMVQSGVAPKDPNIFGLIGKRTATPITPLSPTSVSVVVSSLGISNTLSMI